MTLDAQALDILTKGADADAWKFLVERVLAIASRPLAPAAATSEVTRRDREIGALDHFLALSGWDLWPQFGEVVERTSEHLVCWWSKPYQAKAVLILDGLSLRELPWLLKGANQHGFQPHEVAAMASELPGETNEFAQALGFANRSQLQNNGSGLTHKLNPARTESVDLPWTDCQNLIDGTPNWVFWHHWPDSKIHDGSGAGQGLDTLTQDIAKQLSSDEFWTFVDRLAEGRRLVITSDHGYAATGYFPDANDETGQFLKKTFASGRNTTGTHDAGPFVPPVALRIASAHGDRLFAVGRRKWKSQGGYPTLTHGGLSLLEVLSPWVEISRNGT